LSQSGLPNNAIMVILNPVHCCACSFANEN